MMHWLAWIVFCVLVGFMLAWVVACSHVVINVGDGTVKEGLVIFEPEVNPKEKQK